MGGGPKCSCSSISDWGAQPTTYTVKTRANTKEKKVVLDRRPNFDPKIRQRPKKRSLRIEEPILSQILGEDQKKKEKASRSDNKPTRKSEATMTFFLTNLALLVLRLGGGGGGGAGPPTSPPWLRL